MTRTVRTLIAAAVTASSAVGASAGTSWATEGGPAAGIQSGWVRSDYDTYRGAVLDYTVTGSLAGRTGNAHEVTFLLAWGSDFGMRLQITTSVVQPETLPRTVAPC